ncbi:hypothetical protein B0H14DRAFT_2629056 [Mycena olivaceomarginata]|nr:hypothetical protein B0H14DRAFT_2629056 [Mycena olivaceomarginata]
MPQMLLPTQLIPFPPATPDPPSNTGDARSSDDSDAQEETARPSGSTRRHRIRVTRKNALHGRVEGAMRGNKVFDIVRMKELRPAMADQARASARFLRSASDIIERCERLSQETGCWLHFSAQHLFAHGAFLHYTSPRFLREAKKDAEQITNHASRIYATLIAARNEESKEMHKRLLLAEGDMQVAQEAERNTRLQAETAQREMDLQSEELEAQRLELQALKARLQLAQKKNGTSQ